MALVDHSLTYRVPSLRHLPHRLRLRAITGVVHSLDLPSQPSYADFGCSNGYVSERVRELISAGEAFGFDQEERHFEEGRARYPHIQFASFDLNAVCASPVQCDLVTCFETLEHVGRLDQAVDNLLSAVRWGGTLLLSVPLEVGAVGVAKFTLKMAYGYDLSELPPQPGLMKGYAWALLRGARMSSFRDDRLRWGTHFGFDVRDLDDLLTRPEVELHAWNSFTTRFYVVRKNAAGIAPSEPAALPIEGPRSDSPTN